MPVTLIDTALITLDDYKLYKDPSVAPASQDTALDDHWETLINSISRLFRNFCRTPLVGERDTEYRDGNGESHLWVHRAPIIITDAITIVVKEDKGAGMVTLVKDTDFKVRKDTGELIRFTGGKTLSTWWEGVLNVEVTYTAGRFADTASVDWDLKALAMQGVDWLHTLGPASYGARLVDAGIIRPDAIPAPIKNGLKEYMRKQRV